MVDSRRERRSSRRKSIQSYRVEEQFESIDLGEETSTEATRARDDDDEDDDEGFMPDQDQDDQDEEFNDEANEDEDEDDATPDFEDLPHGDSIIEVDSDLETDSGLRVEISTAAAAGLARPIKVPSALGRRKAAPKVQTTNVIKMRARGVDDAGRSVGQEIRLKDLFGPTHQDLKPVLLTRDRWMGQETLPSRGEGSLHRSYYMNEEARQREVKQTREWYSSNGSESFRVGQKIKALTKEQAALYLANAGAASMNVLMGAVSTPSLYSLNKGSYLSTADPFPSKEDRRGWLLNLGSRIQDAQWAPNEADDTQYLAVAVEQKPNGRQPKSMENPRAPAFTTTPPFPTSIQVWAFKATETGELDENQPPRLDLVICTDWGAPKQIRWCPIACVDSVETSSSEQTMKHIGLLAGIWSDGMIRTLDVSYQWPIDSLPQTQYIHYTHAAFETLVPETIPSCLHWLSATSIAVGTAAGTLAIWTLTRPGTFPSPNNTQERQHNPRPWFYRQVAATYITTLMSSYPSRPNYVSIASADGLTAVIDLRSPVPDICYAQRGRMFPITQSWHEHTQSFLLPDEAYLLRSNAIRKYYRNVYVMRTEAQIVCSATSPVHPSILLGCADGSVVAGNAIARILNSKEVPWQQTWFTHEWRPPVDQLSQKVQKNEASGQEVNKRSSESLETAETVPPEVLSQPLARISEGFRVQQTALHHTKPGSQKHKKDFIRYITIYEEPSCITALAWNPNLKYGTWAVAGMGDGLLRVEDLGV